ncbi:MAG: FAD-dependent oxidoreductase [Sphingomonadales bacterium]|nr:FAD-dependent oxidoreductase [Sphingomonadales bacterium]
MGTTRRSFIQAVGRTGGFSAAYLAMQGLGLLPSYAEAQPLNLQPGSGKGVKVVILGAGMAGLASADELLKAGYDVTILEARARVGGHNWTVRGGDRIEWTDGSVQTCAFEPGHYFNTGPARIPTHHKAMLAYCKELGVELEVEVNASRSAYIRNAAANGGKPIQFRRAINDTRGHVSELLAKAIGQGALDKEMSAADKERMLAFLRQYGELTGDLRYKGSKRSGYTSLPGAADAVGVPNDPIPMSTLLDVDMWNDVLFEDSIDDQATMLQPVGGMDAIPKALAAKIGPAPFKLMSEVKEIRRTASGARIVYLDRKSGKTNEILADYVICTIPLPVLARIPADFSDPIKNTIGDVFYGNAVKIGFESHLHGRRGSHREALGRAAPLRGARDRCDLPRQRQGASQVGRGELGQDPLQRRQQGQSDRGSGRPLPRDEPGRRAVLLRQRLAEPRRLAGRRGPVRAPHGRGDRRAGPRQTRLTGPAEPAQPNCVRLSTLPSGSVNHATCAPPPGGCQMPASSWPKPS